MGFETRVDEYFSTMVQGFARGVHIVHYHNPAERSCYPVGILPQGERAVNVGGALGPAEAALARAVTQAAQQGSGR
ncbi:MAG TPA: hypothetical protein VFH61_03200 [Thermoleophilia bacterium]|nr:hypothetical protein [Thermoleophilia bacterium]